MLQTTTGALLAGVAAQAESAKKKKVIVIGGGIGGLSCAFDLMERGHDVTVLEASRRTGGHVKTIYDPLPDGLYADVGAEQFTNPGYDTYREWVRKFDLPVHGGGAGGCEDAARVRLQ
jgi:monoamine oxidase